VQYLMLVGAAVLLAADFSLNKIYQKLQGTSPAASFGFNSLFGLFTAIIFFVINGFRADFSTYSFIMAAVVNGLVMCYNIIGFRLLKSGTMALYTLFLMSGGMVVPYIFGVFFLGEPFSSLKTAGIMLILVGVILSNANNTKVNSKQIAMFIAVFILNGFVSVISKLHQIEVRFGTVNATDFVLIGGVFKFIFAGTLYLFARNNFAEKTKSKTKIAPFIIIIASAAVGGISYLLQLFGAASLPATVLYPFVTGGSIVLSSLAGIIFFKDKLSKNVIASIILCFLGTILFL